MQGRLSFAIARRLGIGITAAMTATAATAQLTEPTLDVFASASIGSSSDFASEQLDLGAKQSEQAGFSRVLNSVPEGQGGLGAAGLVLLLMTYDLDPWVDFTITIENDGDAPMIASGTLTLGPLAPAASDTVFNSALSLEAVDGTTNTAADGSATIADATPALDDEMIYSNLGGLDSSGFFDGDAALGVTLGEGGTSLSAGESISDSSSLFVGSAPANASDPDAVYGTFTFGYLLTVSAGDTAIIRGRLELIPAPGAASLFAIAGIAAARRRRR